ncbi:MAG: DDE-type integrase/transposase/recombinase [Lachnospiraceae bacterium]|nr:DDE-type integrase/transposase/recombinase [Lachnospiraceae bacterium]
MPSNNRKYSEEIRTQTAVYILETGKSSTSVAEEMGIDKNTVCKWVRDYRRANNLLTYAEENGIKMPPSRESKDERAGNKELKAKIKEKEKELKRLEKQLADEREMVEIRALVRYIEVYLAAVMDLYNREIIGYSISKKIDTELVKAALGNAIRMKGTAEGLIFHSNCGCQYASKSYQKTPAFSSGIYESGCIPSEI